MFSRSVSLYKSVVLIVMMIQTTLWAQVYDSTLGRKYLDSSSIMIDSARYEEALSYGNSAKEIFIRFLGEADTATATAYYQIGKIYRKMDAYEEAIQHQEKAIEIYAAFLGEVKHLMARSYDELGVVYDSKGEYEKAIKFYQKAIDSGLAVLDEKSPLIAQIYSDMGVSYRSIGQHKKALELYQKCLDIRLEIFGEQHPDVANIYLNMGVLHWNQAQYEKALAYYEKALKIQLNIHGEEHISMAGIFHNIGLIYGEWGRYEEALEFHFKALDIKKAVYGENHLGLGIYYNSIGTCYNEMEDLEKALDYYQKALRIWQVTLGEQHLNTAVAYHNIGDTQSYLGNYDDALEYLEKALTILQAVLGEKHPQNAIPYYNIGRVYWNKKNYEKALIATYKSFELRNALGKNHVSLARPYSLLANIYHSMSKHEKAIEYYEKAMDVSLPVFGTEHPDIALIQHNIGAVYLDLGEHEKSLGFLQTALQTRLITFPEGHPLLTTSYEHISKAYEKAGNLKSALVYSHKGLQNMESMRQKYSSALTKQTHLSSHYAVFEHAIDLQTKLASEKNEDVDLEKVFEYIEKAKSNILLEAFKTSRAKSFASIPDNLLEQEYKLEMELAFYEKKHFEEQQKGETKNDSLLSIYQQELFELRQTYDVLIAQFEKKYPTYYRLKYDSRVVSVEEVQANLLQPNQALIEYFVGDSNIFVFLIKANTYKLHTIKKDFPLDTWAKQMRRGIYQYHLKSSASPIDYATHNDTFAIAAHRLYDKLIAPIKAELPHRLIIIPDGILGYLPFEALLTRKPEQRQHFKSHAYLLHEHEISYSYSATLLEEMKSARTKKASKSLLAFAPSFEGNTEKFAATSRERSGLRTLLYNVPEAKSIHAIYRGDIFLGQRATKSAFITHSSEYRILHLATHGKANDKSGDYSFLAFSQRSDTTEDYKLYVRELYNMHLKADLVVLSACETGVGELQRGEGIISLARGFSYAKAKSIITSLWSVNDASTKELMENFYQYLKDGKTKDAALRQAKIDYVERHTNDEAHPFFWAGFVAIGDMDSLDSRMNWWWIGILGILILIIAVGIRRVLAN